MDLKPPGESSDAYKIFATTESFLNFLPDISPKLLGSINRITDDDVRDQLNWISDIPAIVLDSSCSKHVVGTPHHQFISKWHHRIPSLIHTVDRKAAPTIGRADVTIPILLDEQVVHITFTDCIIADFPNTYISASDIADRGGDITINNSGCVVSKNINGIRKVIFRCHRIGKLFVAPVYSDVIASLSVTIMDMHNRFGHADPEVVAKAINKGRVKDIVDYRIAA